MISQGEEDCSFCLMSIVFFFLQAEGTYQCKMRQSLRQCRSLLFLFAFTNIGFVEGTLCIIHGIFRREVILPCG